MNAIEIVLCASLVGIGPSIVPGWKGIVPLRSTRADVERVLGAPTRPCKDGCNYATKTEGVFVRYSGEPCSDGEANRWRVPRDTVIGLSVYYEIKPKLRDLNLDLKKFTKTEDPELQGYFTYDNKDDGVSYTFSNKGVLMGVDWFASSKDEKAFRCTVLRTSVLTQNVQESIYDPHTSIGTFEEDKSRLDQFAFSLKNVPNAKGYVIAYGADLGIAAEAKMRLKCIRDYLMNVHHIKRSRLCMIDGGYADKLKVELFLVRPGDPKPKPSPTRKMTGVLNIKPRANPCR